MSNSPQSGSPNPKPASPGRLVPVRLGRGEGDGGETILGFLPDPLPPEADWVGICGRQAEGLLGATLALGRLDGLAGRLPHPDLLLRPLWAREAQLSSRIEDVVTTAEEVALIGTGDESDEAREVWNYLRALERGMDVSGAIDADLLCALHEILMDGVRGREKAPGRLRDRAVWIGRPGSGPRSARYVPPGASRLEKLLEDLAAFIAAPSERIPKLVAIALAHYQFEAIHPFLDGNGRVGRLLISLLLCRYGLIERPLVYVSAYIDKHKRTYYDLLLGVSRDGAWEDWIAYFLDAVRTQAEDAAVRCGLLVKLRDDMLRRVLDSGKGGAKLDGLIDELFRQPVLSVKMVTESLDVTDVTARRYVELLVSVGVLEEITGGTYAKRYACREVLRLIESDTPEIELQG
ncbi:MAG: Fic family protein [Phycisphaerales bacterium]